MPVRLQVRIGCMAWSDTVLSPLKLKSVQVELAARSALVIRVGPGSHSVNTL